MQVPLSIISATKLMSPAIMAMEAVMDAMVVVVALMEPAAKFFAKSEFEVHLRPNFEFRVNAVYLTVTRLLKFCSGKVFQGVQNRVFELLRKCNFDQAFFTLKWTKILFINRVENKLL